MIVRLALLLILGGVIYLWWRSRTAPAAMPPAEARALLGLEKGATLEQIREAHRRIIAKVHPDAGGSAALAARVNDARDALIDELRRGPRLS